MAHPESILAAAFGNYTPCNHDDKYDSERAHLFVE
jgi:hypothetical protein